MVKTGVSYLGNRIPKYAYLDMEEIAKNNCNFVVHTFSELDLKYHKKVMEEIISASHQQNLEVYLDPWGVGGVFGGESISCFVAQHPDACQVLSNGQRVPHACLNSQKFREFIKDWITVAIDLGAEVIFWDEPHLYYRKDLYQQQVYSCYCPLCQNLYKTIYAEKMPATLTNGIFEFQMKTVVDFLAEASEFVKEKGLQNAVCLYAIKDDPHYDWLWKEVARIKEIDIFGCDPYWLWAGEGVEEFVGYFSQKVSETCRQYNKEGQIWIQAIKIPKGKEKEIEQAVEIAYENGIRNIAAWSYDAGELIDGLASDKPELVWQTLGKAYGKILRRENG